VGGVDLTVRSRFQDRRIIVTGGGSGIGQATVLRLLAEAGTVHALDVDVAGLERTRELAAGGGLDGGTDGRLSTAVCDVSVEPVVTAAVTAAVERMGGLDVVVNNAGILRAAHTHDCPLELWNTVLAVNLTGTFLVSRAALPALLRSGRGVMVNVSSTAADFGHPYLAAYAASKGGIDAFTHAIATEYGRRGLRAVAVKPGSIATGITAAAPTLFPADTDWSLFAAMRPIVSPRTSQADDPMAQMAPPETVAAVIAALASDDGAFITGTAIRVDGGTHA
jgi:NAD(P)-dependent dehydrogenase (short-subunit alcohol dehydrogenase family)